MESDIRRFGKFGFVDLQQRRGPHLTDVIDRNLRFQSASSSGSTSMIFSPRWIAVGAVRRRGGAVHFTLAEPEPNFL
jgi:hypothetical protein